MLSLSFFLNEDILQSIPLVVKFVANPKVSDNSAKLKENFNDAEIIRPSVLSFDFVDEVCFNWFSLVIFFLKLFRYWLIVFFFINFWNGNESRNFEMHFIVYLLFTNMIKQFWSSAEVVCELFEFLFMRLSSFMFFNLLQVLKAPQGDINISKLENNAEVNYEPINPKKDTKITVDLEDDG